MTSEWHSRPRVLVVGASCVAILIAFGAYVKAQVTPVGAEQQVAQLRQQVSALERRVAELEKRRGSAAAGVGQSGGGSSTQNPPRTNAPDNVTTVTAPFVVVDDNGKVVMRVQGEATDDLSRGIYVYGPKDVYPMAHVGIITSDGAGRLWASHAGAKRPAVQVMGGGDEETPAQIAVFNSESYNSLEEQGLMIRNDQHIPAASVVVKNGTGYLALNDKDGKPMMEAGTLQSHKGYVKVSPYRASTSLQGDPSVLVGGSGKN